MVSAKKVVLLAVSATILVTMISPIVSVTADNTGSVDVENETVTAATGEWVSLDGYHIQEDSETVEYEDETDGWVTAERGTDYEMNYGGGNIEALEEGALEDGDTLRTSYTYEATDSTTTSIVTLVPLFAALLILGVIAAAINNSM